MSFPAPLYGKLGISAHGFALATVTVLVHHFSSCGFSWYSVAGRGLILWFPPPGARQLHHVNTPPSWSGYQRGGAPDHSANRLGRRAMFHRPALLTSTCTREVEVSLTPTLILERRAGSEKSRQKPEFGHRVLIERPVLRA